VVWLFVWFMVILKLPILYLAYVLWWAIKDPPDPAAEGGEASAEDGGSPWRPQHRSGNGPHGRPDRRPVPAHARIHH
jgi:hypothetical protein